MQTTNARDASPSRQAPQRARVRPALPDRSAPPVRPGTGLARTHVHASSLGDADRTRCVGCARVWAARLGLGLCGRRTHQLRTHASARDDTATRLCGVAAKMLQILNALSAGATRSSDAVCFPCRPGTYSNTTGQSAARSNAKAASGGLRRAAGCVEYMLKMFDCKRSRGWELRSENSP